MLQHLTLSPNSCRPTGEKMCWASFYMLFSLQSELRENSVPHRSKLNELVIQRHPDKLKMLAVFPISIILVLSLV